MTVWEWFHRADIRPCLCSWYFIGTQLDLSPTGPFLPLFFCWHSICIWLCWNEHESSLTVYSLSISKRYLLCRSETENSFNLQSTLVNRSLLSDRMPRMQACRAMAAESPVHLSRNDISHNVPVDSHGHTQTLSHQGSSSSVILAPRHLLRQGFPG